GRGDACHRSHDRRAPRLRRGEGRPDRVSGKALSRMGTEEDAELVPILPVPRIPGRRTRCPSGDRGSEGNIRAMIDWASLTLGGVTMGPIRLEAVTGSVLAGRPPPLLGQGLRGQ